MIRLGENSLKTARALERQMGQRWLAEVESNRHLAVGCALDIQAGLALFRLYFARSRGVAVKSVDAAIDHLTQLKRLVDQHGAPYIHMQEPHNPQPDITALRALKRHLNRSSYAYPAFRYYAASRKTYNDIRRHMRPWRVYRDADIRAAARLLRESRRLGQLAVEAATGSPQAPFATAWLAYVEREIEWLSPPVMRCGRAWSDWQPLVHDNCFGYGGFAWEDFLGFFEDRPFDKGVRMVCRMRRDSRWLHLQVTESNVNMVDRRRHWQALDGAPDLGGFLRVFLDCENTGERLRQWQVKPGGTAVTYRELFNVGRQDFDLRASRLAKGWKATYSETQDGWDLQLSLSLAALGSTPADGDCWRLNLASNPSVMRNHAVSWCKGYEVGPGNPSRLGRLEFC